MTPVGRPLYRRVMVTVLVIVTLIGSIAAGLIWWLYVATSERAARQYADTAADFYRGRLDGIDAAWTEYVTREIARIESSPLVPKAHAGPAAFRLDPVAAAIAPPLGGLVITAADGSERLRHGRGFSTRWPPLSAIGNKSRRYGADATGAVYMALGLPLSLGKDEMGVLHLMFPLDRGFLDANAYPGTELFVKFHDRVVAGSRATPPATAGNERQLTQIDFPAGADAPQLLIQTRIVPPFSLAEAGGAATISIAILSVLLLLAMKRWFGNQLPRLEMLDQAAVRLVTDGGSAPEVHVALVGAIGGEDDELSRLALSLQTMVAILAKRERERDDAEALLRESEHRFRDIAEAAGEFTWEVGVGRIFLHVSERAGEIFGRPVEDLLGTALGDYIPPGEREQLIQGTTQGRNSEPFLRLALPILRPDGEVRWVAFSGVPVHDQDGGVVAYRGTAEDVTREKRDRERLLLADEVFAHSGQAIIITDVNDIILSVNPAFCRTSGYGAAEVLGWSPRRLIADRHDEGFFLAIRAELEHHGVWSGEIWGKHKSGATYPQWMTVSAVIDPANGVSIRRVSIGSDITERKENEARIEHIAYHDALTGLPNRLALQDRLRQAIAEARRGGQFLALMFIDLDRFKTINDSLGHDAGDQLLVTVAQRLRAALRESDTVARLGGDEFVIIAHDITTPEDAARIAEKVIAQVGQPLTLAEQTLHTSPSIGIAIYPNDGTDVETLMKNADTAMYCVKHEGRNAYRFFAAGMNTAATERLHLESQLHEALGRNEFTLTYQPRMHLATGAVVAVEVRVHWHHPGRGIVAAEQFIPVAEETGLILPLGAWVLEEACRQAVAWEKAGLAPVRIAVNLTSRQFHYADLPQQVAAILAKTGLAADCLELEVSESALMEDTGQTMEILWTLRAQGVHLAIDDFGSGHSSLPYLRRFAIDRLKIDHAFVAELGSDPGNGAIARGIVDLAHVLGLEVTAKGIETADQLALLREFHCVEGEGYLFSQPLDSDAMARLLQRQQGA